jgi:hypothetical protein
VKSATREKDLVKRKAGLMGAAARWDRVSKKERSRLMRIMARYPRPGARKLDRCPCGVMTRARAEKRNHRCVAA